MGNELKLSLENFQSISRGELVFHPGLNFIIGQSNSGKSATFRALKACLSNPVGSQRFIKKGTRKASVLLEYNGNQIIWSRTSKESTYEINGEKYLKTGRSNAFKIIENTGFVRDENDIIMNIEEELQLPFPFGIPSTALFKLYEDVFCISDSAVILKSAKDQEEHIKGSISQSEFELNKYNVKLEALSTFKKEVDVDLLRAYKEQCLSAQTRLLILNKDLPFIRQVKELAAINLPKVERFENKVEQYRDSIGIKKVIVRLSRYHKLLEGFPQLESFQDKTGKLNFLRSLNKCLKEVKALSTVRLPEEISLQDKSENLYSLRDIKKCVEELKVLKEIKFLSTGTFQDCLSKYNTLKDLKKTSSTLEKLDIQVPLISFKSKVEELESLKKYKSELKTIVAKDRDLKEKYTVALAKVSKVEESLKDFKVCPLCRRPLEGEKEC